MFQDYGVGISGPKFNLCEDANTIPKRWRVWRTNLVILMVRLGSVINKRWQDCFTKRVLNCKKFMKVLQMEGATEYEKCNKRLDPEVNKNFERQEFKNVCKEDQESMEQLILRLCNQALITY